LMAFSERVIHALTRRVKRLAENIEHLKEQVEDVKVRIGKVKRLDKVKAVLAKNEEVGRKLDLLTDNMDVKSMGLVELEEEVKTLLREVHEPPSLVDLAVRRVVEERLGVGELPTTLKVKVEGLQEERMEQVGKALTKFYTILFKTVEMNVMEAVEASLDKIDQLIDLAELE